MRDGVKEDQKNPLQCYICNKVGHTTPRCPDIEKRQQNKNATARKSSLKNEDKDRYPTEINGKKLNLRLEEICHQSRNLDQTKRNLEIASA